MSNFLNYMHFPVFSVMVLFLGAFLIVVLGRNKYVRGVIAMLSVGAALACMLALIKPVMFNGEIISYWWATALWLAAMPSASEWKSMHCHCSLGF